MMPPERIGHPLFELATASPEELFDVVVYVVLDPLAPESAYDAVPAVLDQVEAAILRLVPDAKKPNELEPAKPRERITWDVRSAKAPLLEATLTGKHVLDLATEVPPDQPIEVLRQQVKQSDPATDFDKASLIGRVAAEPLGSKIHENGEALYDVIIVLNLNHASGREGAYQRVEHLLNVLADRSPGAAPCTPRKGVSHPYVFVTLIGAQVLALIDLDRNAVPNQQSIFRIWEDTVVQAFITKSIATVKADAAQIAFSAVGRGIVWAVLDSGIDREHPHFRQHENLNVTPPLRHRDFTGSAVAAAPADHDPGALVDPFGHGTHVAGILAGGWLATDTDFTSDGPFDAQKQPVIIRSGRNEAGSEERHVETIKSIAGMAPLCKLLSMRVLDDKGAGKVSTIIEAFDEIQQLNDYGRRVVVHGVNLSAGYPFDAQWFACGQSPVCVEVDRLVQSGVVVVVAAGNSGYGYLSTAFTKAWPAGLAMTINDPGNAERAITVGSTHRDAPHTYGVSYFSSKGPTGDGRLKPDLVAPGERIVSAASAQCRLPNTITNDDGTTQTLGKDDFTYREDSGTSMAAPHVSGLIAAFLSIRNEYVGRPEAVKALFVDNATDLRRDRSYQGSGLVDLMRAIQSV